MATLTATRFTIGQLAKRSHNKNIIEIAEVLNETNEAFRDAPWYEANGFFNHTISKRQSLPTGTWRRINQGVAPSLSLVIQITEDIGNLEDYSEIDDLIARGSGSGFGTLRSGEDRAHVEGLSQTISDAMVYGNHATDPEQFNGIATRYNALSLANVHGAGGTGNVSSIYVIQWGQTMVHLVYPSGSKTMGITHDDQGKMRVYDSSSNPFEAWVSHFYADVGLAIHDDRCIQRVCNIDPAYTGTYSFSASGKDNILLAALNKLPYSKRGAVIYVNEEIQTEMDIAAKDKTNAFYQFRNVFGEDVVHFRGTPVRRMDSILNTESAVS